MQRRLRQRRAQVQIDSNQTAKITRKTRTALPLGAETAVSLRLPRSSRSDSWADVTLQA